MDVLQQMFQQQSMQQQQRMQQQQQQQRMQQQSQVPPQRQVPFGHPGMVYGLPQMQRPQANVPMNGTIGGYMGLGLPQMQRPQANVPMNGSFGGSRGSVVGKVSYRGVMRRIERLPQDVQSFMRWVQEKFGCDGAVKIEYRDEDGDWIRFDGQDEWVGLRQRCLVNGEKKVVFRVVGFEEKRQDVRDLVSMLCGSNVQNNVRPTGFNCVRRNNCVVPQQQVLPKVVSRPRYLFRANKPEEKEVERPIQFKVVRRPSPVNDEKETKPLSRFIERVEEDGAVKYYFKFGQKESEESEVNKSESNEKNESEDNIGSEYINSDSEDSESEYDESESEDYIDESEATEEEVRIVNVCVDENGEEIEGSEDMFDENSQEVDESEDSYESGLAVLEELGFTKSLARDTLHQVNGDVNRALDILAL